MAFALDDFEHLIGRFPHAAVSYCLCDGTGCLSCIATHQWRNAKGAER
jgi:hypothetical protein